MIIRPLPDGLLCIRQLDHSALSGGLAHAWGGSMPALAPRESVELAIARHDAGWPELDATPVRDPRTGLPHTYRTIATAEALAVAERSVARVGGEDPYAGWLVSRHFASFHADSEVPEARMWVTAQVGHRAELLARAWPRVGRDALHPHVLEANFDWLQFLDAVSLMLCENRESWKSRETCAGYGERTTTFRYRRLGSADPLKVNGSVEPWPFARGELFGEVPALVLEPGPWPDAAAFALAWAAARPARLEVALSPG